MQKREVKGRPGDLEARCANAARDYAAVIEPVMTNSGWSQEDLERAFRAGARWRNDHHIFTADEASHRLRMPKRVVIRYGRSLGCCSEVGNSVFFDEDDLLHIWHACRVAPTRETVNYRSIRSEYSDGIFALMGTPGTGTCVDKREVEVLRVLASKKSPVPWKSIPRFGPATLTAFISKGLVENCGSENGIPAFVQITPLGRDQIRNKDRWTKAEEKYRKGRRELKGW